MKRLSTDNQGQALILMAGFMAFFIGVAGIGADVGSIFSTKNKAQRVADAASMAGLTYYLDHLDEDDPNTAVNEAQVKAGQVSQLVANLNMAKMGLPVKNRANVLNIENALYDNAITNTLTLTTEAKTIFFQFFGADAGQVSVTAVSQTVPAVVSLVLDTSNSMDNTEFQLLKDASINFVHQFQPRLDRVAIVTISAFAKVEREMGTFASYDELDDVIGKTLATGIQRTDGTNLAHAIERAREEIEKVAGTTAAPKNNLPKNAIKAIVIFSDGATNAMRGRFLNPLQSNTRGIPNWQGPLEPNSAPKIDALDIADKFSDTYDYGFYTSYFNGNSWLSAYYNPDRRPPAFVTLFKDPRDISRNMIKSNARDFVRCEETPRPLDYRQYVETGWSCLQSFAYRDSRGAVHGDWIDGQLSFWCDGCTYNKGTDDLTGAVYEYWTSVQGDLSRIWSSLGAVAEEVYNSAIYEADYAKEDNITIYAIALGQTREQDPAEPHPIPVWCPGTNSWLAAGAECPQQVLCKDGILRPGSGYKDACPAEYCRNEVVDYTDQYGRPFYKFRKKNGANDHCAPVLCSDGSTPVNGKCPGIPPPTYITCDDGIQSTWCFPCPGGGTASTPSQCPSGDAQ